MLYTRFAPKLKSICIRYVKDSDEAKDVLQDSFIKIFHQLDKYKGEGSFEGWMKRIVINTTLDHIKKNQKLLLDKSEDLALLEISEDENEVSNSDKWLDAGFTANDLLEILGRIPNEYGVVFNMFHIDGLAHKEIGQLLQIGESTSRKRLFVARKLLQRELEKVMINK